jgi:hypothetical protein
MRPGKFKKEHYHDLICIHRLVRTGDIQRAFGKPLIQFSVSKLVLTSTYPSWPFQSKS